MITYVLAVLCVVSIACGQILFKLTANALAETGSIFAGKTFTILFCALALYGLTTLGWIWVLQKGSLSRIYPIMALSFVFVPILSHFLLGEKFNTQYFVGVGLLLCGIVLTIKS